VLSISENEGQEMIDGLPWYLAQVKSQSYQIAERNLHRQLYETFIPRLNKTDTGTGRFVTKPKPLFPGYIFVSCDVQSGAAAKINSTLGISRLVNVAGRPVEVPRSIIEALKARCGQDSILAEDISVAVGDEVLLLTGPFTDFVASVERIEPSRRIWVLIDLLGRKTRVGLERASWRAA
jgi:transcriptional antiterminator RfaH